MAPHVHPVIHAPRIDVHAHFVPPDWRTLQEDTGHEHPDGMPGIPQWTAQGHIDMMESLNIKKSILSISSPGTYLVNNYDKLARRTARECNEYAYNLKRKHPEKFGYWAVLPLPDVEGSLREMDYALEHLNADGICLETNAHGHYNGDEKFDPIFARLNHHKATVFIHPTAPCMHSCDTRIDTITAAPLPEYPFPIFEFMFDTARSLMNLFLSGTVEKYPDIKYIIPHAGGAFPPLVQRFANIPQMIGHPKFVDEEDVRKALKEQFWWDLAGFVFPDQIKGLLPYADKKKIMYGSDYPYTPIDNVEEVATEMAELLPQQFPTQEEQDDIYYNNAARLLGMKPEHNHHK